MAAPPEQAITETLAGVSEPALILDLERGVLLAANRAGGDLWTGSARMAVLPQSLDAAMPALGVLRLALGAAHRAPQSEPLTYWAACGVRSWRSQLQLVAGARAGIVLVRLDPIDPAAATADTPLPGRELRHLVHELRTPLAAILSLADILHGGHLGVIASDRHRDYLASMRDTARHALDVIEAMVAQSSGPQSSVHRLGAGRAAGLDLSAAVAEVAAGMSGLAARSGARLSVPAGAPLPLIAADGTAVRQMLINLAANALAHAGGGVTVTITTGVGVGHAIWAEVADNGPGLPPAVIAWLATGSSPEAGPRSAGRPQLGLSLTRALAEANGARLEVSSGPDGARMRLVFAAYQEPGGDQVAPSSSG